jgi:hypothetical protein
MTRRSGSMSGGVGGLAGRAGRADPADRRQRGHPRGQLRRRPAGGVDPLLPGRSRTGTCATCSAITAEPHHRTRTWPRGPARGPMGPSTNPVEGPMTSYQEVLCRGLELGHCVRCHSRRNRGRVGQQRGSRLGSWSTAVHHLNAGADTAGRPAVRAGSPRGRSSPSSRPSDSSSTLSRFG